MNQEESTLSKETNTKKKFYTSKIARELTEGLGKVPPQALELEQAVLGALMLEKDALTTVVDILHPESFYKEQHQAIYSAIQDLFKNSEPIDMLTVTNQLRKDGKLDFVGGAYYITQLTRGVNSSANIESHARVVLEKSIKRELISISSKVQTDAYEDANDAFELLDSAEQMLFEVSESNIRKNYDSMRSLLGQAIKEIEERKNHKDGLTGVPSGFTALDRVTSGWQPSDLVIIAARPGMGKCLGKGTKVLMYDGSLKMVEDVVQGDQLMGDDSTPRTVKSIATGRENMYWVHQNKGISYRVNESHILSLKRSRREGSHEHGEVLNIEVRDYLSKSDKFKYNYKGYKVAVEFEEQATELDPYFLGLWLGDGHSYSSRITNEEEEVINFLNEYANDLELELITYEQTAKTKSYAITTGSRGKRNFYSVQGELRKLNLLENKHIPNHFLINSTEKRMKLLAGIIDADGYYDNENLVFEIVQKNKKLASQIKFLCDTLGYKTSLVSKKATIKSRNVETEVYRIRISGNLEDIPVRINRKKARKRTSIADWRHTGVSLEFDKVDDYYGFEIDGNRLFLLEDMTVTHNTAFVVSALRNAAVDHKKPVAIFSLEMSSIQLVNRLISAEAELDSEKIKKGNLAEHEWEQLVHKTSKLSDAPIFIDDTPALSILELRAKCRRLRAQHNVQLIVIDYMQLMSGDVNKGAGNREQEIASISRALKGIAKELNVPVIALSQLSRAVETRGGEKRPQLSDLRESGSIEQDADIVMFLYRPEYYGITEDENGLPTTGTGEVIISKHRNGSLTDIPLKFIGQFTKFADLDAVDFSGGFSNAGVPAEFDSGQGAITKLSKINDDTPPESGGTEFGNEENNDSDEAPF